MKIPISKPYFTEREREMVVKPLESGWVTQGEYVAQLEDKFREFTGAKHAIATSSCTAAQFMASRCIDLQAGDEVLTPAFTWISTANAAEFVGAKPIFIDIDLDTFNINVKSMEACITDRTKAIFPVNLFGLPASLREIQAIAQKYNLDIVEDAACSLGGYVGGRHTGNFGACGCFSMHARKSITTGEGGVMVTNSDDIANMARSLRDQGSSQSGFERHGREFGLLLPEFTNLGYNFRLTDIQAAVGLAQMEKLNYILKRRREIVGCYMEAFKDLDSLILPKVPEGLTHAFQSFVCLLKPRGIKNLVGLGDFDAIESFSQRRNQIMVCLQERGISTRQGTHAVHLQKYYSQKYGIKALDFPNSYIADRLSLALPLYAQMTQEEQNFVINNLKEVVAKI